MIDTEVAEGIQGVFMCPGVFQNWGNSTGVKIQEDVDNPWGNPQKVIYKWYVFRSYVCHLEGTIKQFWIKKNNRIQRDTIHTLPTRPGAAIASGMRGILGLRSFGHSGALTAIG